MPKPAHRRRRVEGLIFRGNAKGRPSTEPARDQPDQIDRTGPIVVARCPAPVAFESPDPRRVHPLLAYADLMRTNDDARAPEAAAELYDRYLTVLERAA